MTKENSPGRLMVANNKKAFFNYEILEKLEVGIQLQGCEVKSIRAGHVAIRDAYARVINNELWLVGAQIQPYEFGNRANPDPMRDRRLLIHRRQLVKWRSKINEKQYTIVPLQLYFIKGMVKLEIGLAKSKKQFDKRADLKEKDSQRAIDRALRYR